MVIEVYLTHHDVFCALLRQSKGYPARRNEKCINFIAWLLQAIVCEKWKKALSIKEMIKIAFKMTPYPSEVHFHKIVVFCEFVLF